MEPSNRTIWTMWYQGYDEAPYLVRAALDSWIRLNPDWQVVALDRRSLSDWIDLKSIVNLDRSDLTVQKVAVINRLCLLRRYGGIWTDGTVFCLRPVSEWLPEYYGSGFFAFRNPGPDRLASNWLIASEPDNPILIAVHDAFLKFWNDHPLFPNQDNVFGKMALAFLSYILNRNVGNTVWWLAPPLQKIVGAYPYFVFHYTFNKVILSDPALGTLWNETKALEAGPCHELQSLAGIPDGAAAAEARIRTENWPVQKLDWRIDPSSPYWSRVLSCLAATVADVPQAAYAE